MSLSMVLISTTTFVLQTIPEFQVNGEYVTVYKILDTIDMAAMVFFTFEYLTRLICCPRKLSFLIRNGETQFPCFTVAYIDIKKSFVKYKETKNLFRTINNN